MNIERPKSRLPAPVRQGILDLQASKIRAISREGQIMAHAGTDVIGLWFGEGDEATPSFICDAAAEAMRNGKTFYTPNAGVPELRSAISRYASNLFGRPIAQERIVVSASGMNAIMQVAETLLDAGDNMVAVAPVWPNVLECARIMGAEAREVVLDARSDGGYSLDLDRLFAACDDRTRIIFINTPGNPTGWMMPEVQVRAVIDFCRKRRIWAVADEVYSRIVYGRSHAPSFLEFSEPDDPIISINSFSKAWSMTGWRLGWIVAPADLVPVLEKVNEFNISGPTTFAQFGGVAALDGGEAYVKKLVARYAEAGELVYSRLSRLPRVRLARPEAAFYAFFALEGMTDSLSFAFRLLREGHIGLAPGAAFGPAGEGRLRLCFAAQLKTLNAALDRLEPFLR